MTVSPFLGALKNALLTAYVKNEAPGKKPDWVGLLKRETAKAVTSTAAGKLKCAGMANGDMVVFTVLAGAVGLVLGRAYFVVGVVGEALELSQTEGGPAESTIECTAGSEFAKVVEQTNSGESKRIKTAFGAAVKSVAEDAEAHAIKCLINAQINYGGYFNAEAAGKADVLCEVSQESFTGGAGTYTVSNGKLDLLGIA